MIKKNVCMRLSPERNLQLGFKGDLMFKLDMEYTLGLVFGVLLIDGKDGERLSKEDSESEMSQQRHSDAIKTLCLCCSV